MVKNKSNEDLQMSDGVIKSILESNTKNTEMILNEFNNVYKKIDENKKELTNKIDSLDIKLDDFKENIFEKQLSCAKNNVTKSWFFPIVTIIISIFLGTVGVFGYINYNVVERVTRNEETIKNNIVDIPDDNKIIKNKK